MGPFEHIETLPPDPIFGLSEEYKNDPRQDKFTLVTGYFRGEDLKTPLLKSVARIEEQLSDAKERKEYLPIDGDQEFIQELEKLVFGATAEEIIGFQTVGGTGALYHIGRLATHFTDQIAISDPTWANHWKIFAEAGLKTTGYPYYRDKKLLFEELIEKLNSLPPKSCVLLHTNAHNPTGMDLSKEQWKEISDLLRKKKLFPILDMAYQGFSGAPEEDAFAATLFLKEGHEFALTYTCAKNFSIYGERAGALFIVAGSKEKREAVRSQIKSEIRGNYSNPPMHAASIVKGILKNPELRNLWLEELSTMRERMGAMRKQFVDLLSKKEPGHSWETLHAGRGLFFYSEKSPEEVLRLRKEAGFYLAADGRINLTGLNQANISAFVEAFGNYL